VRILSTLLLVSLGLAGCRSPEPIEFERMHRSTKSLDKDLVEKAALTEDWDKIKSHLLSVDEQSLALTDKSYALYWMGVTQYKTGQHQGADYSWSKAQNFSPSPQLSAQIEQARRSLKSYGHSDQISSGQIDYGRGRWMIQFGIFRLKKSAEDCASSLAWEGLNLQINNINHDGESHWLVWSGPYTGAEVTERRQSLDQKRLKYLVKNIDSLQR
jgi:uncharacterized protein YcfL